MPLQTAAPRKPARKPTRYNMYGASWPTDLDPAERELQCIQMGGRWKLGNGHEVGEGLAHHFKEFARHVWPGMKRNRWMDVQIDNWVSHRSVVVLGPKSSSKTAISGALCHLIDYYAFPKCTTVLCCSTTRERLEDRVWGEIKRLHRMAKESRPWLPGHLIEGRQRLVTDPRSDSEEGRDFRNGFIGVPALKGGGSEGISAFVGVKNARVRLLADELSLLPLSIIHALANLDGNPDFKVTGLGNPKDTTDALGVLAEPAAKLGGWDAGIDQNPGTKTWETKRPGGVCVQLWGPDSPNLDGKLGIPLITQDQIDRDAEFYGKDSLQFTMMNMGVMPRGQGSRRVLTRQMCSKFGALSEPRWLDERLTHIAFLDAAYRSVGGDRCIFGELVFGAEAPSEDPTAPATDTFIARGQTPPRPRTILALVDIMNVPIRGGVADLPEDQIVEFVMGQCKSRGIPPEQFFFDAAMRTSLVSAFSRLWSPSIESIDFMGQADDVRVSDQISMTCREYYANKITQVWFDVRLAVEARQVRGMTDDLVMEFSSREWGMVAGNKIKVEPKEKMREKVGRSPDLADAFAIGVHGARRRGFIISRLAPPKEARFHGGPDWRDKVRQEARELSLAGGLDYSA